VVHYITMTDCSVRCVGWAVRGATHLVNPMQTDGHYMLAPRLLITRAVIPRNTLPIKHNTGSVAVLNRSAIVGARRVHHTTQMKACNTQIRIRPTKYLLSMRQLASQVILGNSTCYYVVGGGYQQ